MNRQDRDSVHSTPHLPGLLWLTLMNWHGGDFDCGSNILVRRLLIRGVPGWLWLFSFPPSHQITKLQSRRKYMLQCAETEKFIDWK